MAFLEGEPGISVSGFHQVLDRFPVPPGFVHERSQLFVTNTRPLLEELLELVSIESTQWIIESGLRDRPVDERTPVGIEAVELEESLEP